MQINMDNNHLHKNNFLFILTFSNLWQQWKNFIQVFHDTETSQNVGETIQLFTDINIVLFKYNCSMNSGTKYITSEANINCITIKSNLYHLK